MAMIYDMGADQLRQHAATPGGMAALVAERDRRQNELTQQNNAAVANHTKRLAEMAATGRPISANYTNPTTGVANLAAEDAAWAPGAGLERIARMEYDHAPGVRQMDAAQLREFVESGGAAAWRQAELARNPAPTGGPFGGARAPAFEEQLGYGAPTITDSAGPMQPLASKPPAATPAITSAPGAAPVALAPPTALPAVAPAPAATPGAANSDVVPRLNALLDENNPLIRQARAQGLAAGNRRGLLNSSMAAGAAQGEAYKAAVPIALQDAAQAHQTNLANADIAAQMDRLRTQAGFNTDAQIRELQGQFERLRFSSNADDQRQARDIAAQLERLGVSGAQQIGAIQAQGQVQGGLQSQQIAAEAERQRVAGLQQIGSIQAQGQVQGTLNAQTIAAEMARLERQLAGADASQAAEIRAQMDRLRESGAQQSGLAQQQFGYQQQLNAQAAELDTRRIELQGNIQSALQAQGAQQQTAFARVQSELQQVLQSQANDQQLQRMGAEFAQQRQTQERDLAASMERLLTSGDQEIARLAAAHGNEMQRLGVQIAAGDRQAIAQSMINIFQAEAAIRQGLLANTAMPAAERAAYEQAIARMGDPARAFINQLYSAPATGLNAGGALPPATPATPTVPPSTPYLPGAPIMDQPALPPSGGGGVNSDMNAMNLVVDINNPNAPAIATGGLAAGFADIEELTRFRAGLPR